MLLLLLPPPLLLLLLLQRQRRVCALHALCVQHVERKPNPRSVS